MAIYAVDGFGNVAVPQPAAINVSNPLKKKAIIIAGGSASATIANASHAYAALLQQGYGPDKREL